MWNPKHRAQPAAAIPLPASRPVSEVTPHELRARFEATMLPHLDAAYSLARYLSCDRDAADDIVQDAFLRAWRGFGSFGGRGAKAWILTIVRRCHLDWRASRRRGAADVRIDGTGAAGDPDEEDAPAFDMASDNDTPEMSLLRTDEAASVQRILERLSEPYREILVLRDLEDLSYREIADVCAIPIGTVMSRLARARQAFATAWAATEEVRP